MARKKAISELKPAVPQFNFTCRNERQKQYIKSYLDNWIAFLTGPAGTGKTTVAIAAALIDLFTGRSQRIYLSRPMKSAGEDIGTLPGTLEDRFGPWLSSFEDAIEGIGGPPLAKIASSVVMLPVGMARGRTVRNGTLIVDEAQNCTYDQLVLLASRAGTPGRVVFCGDESQSDIRHDGVSPLIRLYERTQHVPGVMQVAFLPEDQLRRRELIEFLAAAQGETERKRRR